ncbi:hypothetical protein Q671_03850 [Halomonas sp. PBN3]|nr:hypothetical protein Q671_03850 [Halomonas sp. PBN3]
MLPERRLEAPARRLPDDGAVQRLGPERQDEAAP